MPLQTKIERTKLHIEQWYEAWKGKVYVAFSGGKDSTVLLHLVRSIYPSVPAVFIDNDLPSLLTVPLLRAGVPVDALFPPKMLEMRKTK